MLARPRVVAQMKPVNMVLRGSRKTSRRGRRERAGFANRRSAAARARGAEICGFVCRGARAIRLAGARVAVSGFTGTVAAGSAAGGDRAGVGDFRDGSCDRAAAKAATLAAKRSGEFPQKISYFVDAGAEVDSRRRAGFSERFADVRGIVTARGRGASATQGI